MDIENPIQKLYDDKQYGISFLIRLGEYIGLSMTECKLCEEITPSFVSSTHYETSQICMVCESVKKTL